MKCKAEYFDLMVLSFFVEDRFSDGHGSKYWSNSPEVIFKFI